MNNIDTMMINECEVAPEKLVALLNYDGMPITASYVQSKVNEYLQAATVTPLRRKA